MDFSGVLKGLSIAAAVAAIIGAGALMALPGFGRWITEKVAGFFNDHDHEDVEDGVSDEEDAADLGPDHCDAIGGHDYDDGVCVHCGDAYEGDY